MLMFSVTSCKKYLDINVNPNNSTTASPELLLPGALTTTASLLVSYHDYGAWTTGYQANAYGYSYVGSTVVTYNYTTSSNTGLWSGTFTNLKDYQYIITNTTGVESYVLFNSVARIMKSFDYHLLVDEYGDVPYTNALTGTNNLTPTYDDAATVYKTLITELDAAIAQLKKYSSNTNVTQLGKADIMFAGSITKWIQFANNLKLRLLIRAQNSSLSSFVSTEFSTFSSEGFLTDDAIINPGYSSSSANQNPMWDTYHSSYSGTATSSGKSRLPTKFILAFYNGTKLTDTKRLALTYKNGSSVPNNQLGIEPGTSAAPISGYPAWYIGTGTGASATEAQGILKSRIMGQPIMLAAETYFLLAEAALEGRTLSGDAKTNFDKGILASFTYLEKYGSTNAVPSTSAPSTDATSYQTANATNYLANYSAATSDAQRLEAIITQKYIALNYIHGFEAWSEFRRTAYPAIVNGSSSATATFASVVSVSTRADKLPVRLFYPQTEYNLSSNTPRGIDAFTTRIFWDPN